MISNWILSFVKLFGAHFNDVFAAALAVLFVYWLLRYDIITLGRLASSLKKLNTALDAIKTNGMSSLEEIGCIFESVNNPVLKGIWESYHKDLQTAVHKDRSIEAANYFNIASVLQTPAYRKRMENIPAVLVSAGVGGGFLGLMVGMEETSAVGSYDVLLNVAAGSLGIFIAAIALSLLYQLLDGFLYSRALSEANTFFDLLERKIPCTNTSGYLALFLKEQKQQTDSLQKLTEDTRAGLSRLVSTELVPAVSKSFENTVSKLLMPVMNNMDRTVRQLSDMTVKNQTEVIQKIVDNFASNLDSALNIRFRELGTQVRQSVDSLGKARENLEILILELIKNTRDHMEINEATEAAVRAVAGYHEQIVASAKELPLMLEKVEALTGTLAAVTGSTGEMVERLNERQLKLQEEYSSISESIRGQTVKLQQEFGGQVDKTLAQFTQTAGIAFDKLEIGMIRSMDEAASGSKQMLEHLEEQMREIGVNISELAGHMNVLNENLGHTVKDFNEQIQRGIVKTFDEFDQGLGEICMRLGGTISQIRDSIDDLPAVVNGLKSTAAAAREEDM